MPFKVIEHGTDRKLVHVQYELLLLVHSNFCRITYIKQVLQDLHNCCTTVAALISTRPGRYAVIGCKLKQNANEGCNSCAILAGFVLCFIACFILLVIAPL